MNVQRLLAVAVAANLAAGGAVVVARRDSGSRSAVTLPGFEGPSLSRAEYVTRVNGLCREATDEAARRFVQGLPTGSAALDRTLTELTQVAEDVLRRIAVVRPPPEDEERVRAFLGHNADQLRYSRQLFDLRRQAVAGESIGEDEMAAVVTGVTVARREASAAAASLGLTACASVAAPA